MKIADPKESLTPTPPQRQRCPHVSRNGRPCRYLAASLTEPYCKYHLPDNSTEVFKDLLEKMAQNFDTPEGVGNVLYTIFFWAATGYISERKAAMLTYVAQTILTRLAKTFYSSWKRQWRVMSGEWRDKSPSPRVYCSTEAEVLMRKGMRRRSVR